MSLPPSSRTPVSLSPDTSTCSTLPCTTAIPRAASCSHCSSVGSGAVCSNSVTLSLSCRNNCTWCMAIGLVASTPIAWSLTSQPWQYGQCTTSLPQRSVSPGTSGSTSVRPVVTSSRRPRYVVPSASSTTKPSPARRAPVTVPSANSPPYPCTSWRPMA